ncbi:hypothetical protein TWF730_008425 [Orbilia blumenaviensis]|uniref:Uncharacterized protein n=1 Tax=Orbilia blumenaviensis TaxID=1796055 RepID=A0AAV9V5B2_9PEZI
MSEPASSIDQNELASSAAGNPDAAQDLYGLGIRIGLYFQALGWILYSYSDRKGLRLASGSITIPILISWFIFASKQLFSPCEAFIILVILASLNFPAKATLQNFEFKEINTEATGVLMLLLVELGICSALLWLFSTLVNNLPTLQTENVTFFFAKVSFTGWFRILALIYCVLDAATSIWFCYKVYRAYYWPGKEDPRKILKPEPVYYSLYWAVWLLVVLGVELTIKWNRLAPVTDFQSPGQLIPFITGIIILVDSILVAGNEIGNRISKILDAFTGATSSRKTQPPTLSYP